ncbi:MAG: phosphodiester glycosidase family protein [Clostridia bacterium]|nr:phosphodiester glycosidase family protein [Clostridia bacterium]
MNRIGKCLTCCIQLILMLLLLAVPAWADEPFPELNENGFLDEGEFVSFDSENGIWRYASETLRVEIQRFTTTKPKRIWYEAEVYSAEGEIFRAIPYDESRWMKNLAYPFRTARKHQTVFAINGDFSHLRISKKAKPGILIRNGEIVSERTGPRNRSQFPNLDTMAILPDGDMRVFWSDELAPEDYLAMGAVDVISFGPFLIRDGELNSKALKKYGTGSAQRTAIGMVEKGHYIAIMVEGRHKKSIGSSIAFAAERIFERGCTTAINLDGGQSSAMVFMGYQICKVVNTSGHVASARRAAEILGIGTSQLVAGDDEPMGGPKTEGSIRQ